ncbi:PAS domain-containing sensor histidine kinase [Thiorhodovibrio frisius]|uniref:histidine kinase n=1 Tax=Thiorhodovibrio frisius TaxID=631362 RepID=H8Z5S7_9GAMM|nr:PAS domain-containing sensor histidine kinase [Thiorhodovibrio frisius]EIC19561.1 PAS domain S-box [Thiorhodovibrio frisius]WPL20477.1 Sensory/regulatory protein RpfC [Thiorhodovibrio frisius]
MNDTTDPESPTALSQRMLQVVNATPVGVCITNSQGIFEFVNPAYCRFYGYRPDELLGQHFTMVVPPENKSLMRELHDRFIAGHNEVRGEWEVLDRDGNTKQIMADATHIRGNDGQPRKVTFIMDITERIRHERMREDVERLMRHDLRTPLNAIINIPALICEDANVSDEQRELLDIVERSARTMVEMIDASLNLYKLEAGSYPLQGEPLDLLELLSRVLVDCERATARRGQQGQLLLGDRPVTSTDRCSLRGEPLLYYNLFANLTKNAFEATPTDGQISLRVMCRSNGARVEIHNQGCIPAEIQPKFFDKYVTQGKSTGNGLGTYSARLIVDAVGGSIGFHSSEDTGTLLWVELPDDSCRADSAG